MEFALLVSYLGVLEAIGNLAKLGISFLPLKLPTSMGIYRLKCTCFEFKAKAQIRIKCKSFEEEQNPN